MNSISAAPYRAISRVQRWSLHSPRKQILQASASPTSPTRLPVPSPCSAVLRFLTGTLSALARRSPARFVQGAGKASTTRIALAQAQTPCMLPRRQPRSSARPAVLAEANVRPSQTMRLREDRRTEKIIDPFVPRMYDIFTQPAVDTPP